MGDPFMPADRYGRTLPKSSVNLLVRTVARSASFYRDVFGVAVRYLDDDFMALQVHGRDFLLHADHTDDDHPLQTRLHGSGQRGAGAELRVFRVALDKGKRALG